MAFVMFVVVLIFLVVWPLIWYYYFKAKYAVAPTQPSTMTIDPNNILMEPTFYRGETKLAFALGSHTYILSADDAESFIKRMRANNLTVRTMNEIKSLQ